MQFDSKISVLEHHLGLYLFKKMLFPTSNNLPQSQANIYYSKCEVSRLYASFYEL